MSQLPPVSVIIPVYNQERYIGSSLRSIISQSLTRDSYEIIVVNDGSTDKTLEAIKPYMSEIRLISSDECLGLPSALNRGIREAVGQFVVRLDSDDYVHQDYLKILLMHLRMNPLFDAVACDYLLIDDHTVISHENCEKNPIGCGIMFRIEQLIDIGFYDEEFLSNEDKDLRIRFLNRFQIERIKLPLYRYRRHGNNMTNDPQRMKAFDDAIKIKHS